MLPDLTLSFRPQNDSIFSNFVYKNFLSDWIFIREIKNKTMSFLLANNNCYNFNKMIPQNLALKPPKKENEKRGSYWHKKVRNLYLKLLIKNIFREMINHSNKIFEVLLLAIS